MADTLAGLGLRPSRRWGQSFLVDPFVADAEAALTGTQPGEPVLEIGGGLGILTEALVRRGTSPLTIIERDRRLVAHLRLRFGSRVQVIEGDALTHAWPDARVVVGNLPFSIASPIVFRVLEARGPRGVFLVQREVAQRLVAGPGSRAYGRLTIMAALYGQWEPHAIVPAGAFYPAPAVDGQLVSFTPREGPLPVPEPVRLERVVQGLFGSRRKQLRHLLPRFIEPPEEAPRVARDAGWPADWPTRRAETLPPESFFRLVQQLEGRTPLARPPSTS